MSQVAVVIPARGESTRLPGKMLLNETGYPLVVHTAARGRDAAKASKGLISRVLIATDTEEIKAAAEAHGFEAVMTRKDHRSGTDRLAEAAGHIDEELIVNLQGDEPEMPASIILAVAKALAEGKAPLVTAAFPISRSDMDNPALVKVVCDMTGNALYFSRAPIPYLRKDRSAEKLSPLGHFGIYGYTKELLTEFPTWPEGELEYCEALEQLRFLERGHKMHVVQVEDQTKGVDTPEDYAGFVKRYKQSRKRSP